MNDMNFAEPDLVGIRNQLREEINALLEKYPIKSCVIVTRLDASTGHEDEMTISGTPQGVSMISELFDAAEGATFAWHRQMQARDAQ